jgi:cysteine synthase A
MADLPSILSAGTLAAAVEHAEAAFPAESCGLILHDGSYHAGSNEQDDLHRVDPRTYERDERCGFTLDRQSAELLVFADHGAQPLAVVHSHPNGIAYLSDIDRAGAERASDPVTPQVVIGVVDGTATDAVAYDGGSGSGFIEAARWRRARGGRFVRVEPAESDPVVVVDHGIGASCVVGGGSVPDVLASAALTIGERARQAWFDARRGGIRPDAELRFDSRRVGRHDRIAGGTLDVSVHPGKVRRATGRPDLVAAHVVDTAAPTPVVDVSCLVDSPGSRLLVKLETATPTGSHKFRAARAAVMAALGEGRVRPGTRLLAPTGGNYGAAVVVLGHALGLEVVLTVPDDYPAAKIGFLRAAGAHVHLADHTQGADAHGVLASELAWADPDGTLLLDQFGDPANIAGHVGTGMELVEALGEDGIDCYVGGIGSGASLTGIARVLCAANPRIRVVAVQPDGCNVLAGECRVGHGIPGLAVGGPPMNLQSNLINEVESVSRVEAVELCLAALDRCGVSVGISTGANLAVARRVIRRSPVPITVATVAYDRLEGYLDVI